MENFELAMEIITVVIGIAGLVWFGLVVHVATIFQTWRPGR